VGGEDVPRDEEEETGEPFAVELMIDGLLLVTPLFVGTTEGGGGTR